ncbi:MAG: WD40 repeat domain-containing protein [Chloroflexi bacterium]|nr:WD40 repeat domain-containing protein [Chloroflexota bacterium]
MPDEDSLPTSEPEENKSAERDGAQGGVSIGNSAQVTVGGDIVGRDKIVGYTAGQVRALIADLAGQFQPKPFDGQCPYLGLDAFTEEDADRFFGREKSVAELVARVSEARAVVIAGPSGSGKSSLARAGLIHALRQGALPGSDRWLYASLAPGRDPLEALARATSSLARSLDAGGDLRTRGLTDTTILHQWAEIALEDRRDRRAVILVDQFEELFAQVPKERERERIAFLSQLTHAATAEGGRVIVLFAMRSDFVSNCAAYPELNALLNRQFFQVGAMGHDELVSAIALPALQVGLRIDPDLIAQIVNDMQDRPGALPLMQFALKDLFDAGQTKGGPIALTLVDYLARGGLHKALERHADAAFASLTEAEQGLARHVFTGLIQIGRGAQDTRRTAQFAELVPAGADAANVESVVRKLADARLITTGESDEGEARARTVTLAHERLIDAWPWLRRLVNENRDAIALQNQIAEDAQEWESRQRDASYLYGGARLATAREQLAAKKLALSGLALAFVEAGVEAEAAERRARQRRTQVAFAALAMVALVVGVLAVFAYGQRNDAIAQKATAQAASTLALGEANTRATAEADAREKQAEAERQARIARSGQLAVQAISLLDKQPALSFLLSVEALRAQDTAEARSSLLTALTFSPRLSAFLTGHRAGVTSVAFSPTDGILASGSEDKTIILWDVATRQPLGLPFTGHADNVTTVAFSPDGKLLASASRDDTVFLWDVSTRQRIDPPLKGYAVAFSPDGGTLASSTFNGTVLLWDLTTLEPLDPPLYSYYDEYMDHLVFNPDGYVLAADGRDGTILVWDVATHEQLSHAGSGHTANVTSLAYGIFGDIASGSEDTTIIWRDQTLHRHTATVSSLAFSPDGDFLASGSADKTVIVWDVSRWDEPALPESPLVGHAAPVTSVAFSADGEVLASGSADTTVILWDAWPTAAMNNPDPLTLDAATIQAWLTRACRIANRNLTHAEWAQYMGDEPYRKTCEQWEEGK